VTFSQIIYQIRFWRLQRRMIDNTPCNGQKHTLSFYAVQSSLPDPVTLAIPSHKIFLRGIAMAKRDMKTELIAQNKAKVAYQHDLATDIIHTPPRI
jgi:hypothetical protein